MDKEIGKRYGRLTEVEDTGRRYRGTIIYKASATAVISNTSAPINCIPATLFHADAPDTRSRI